MIGGILLYTLVITNLISMVHLGLFIVGADVYDIKDSARKKKRKPSDAAQPLVSVVVPAHNESVVIKRTLDSILKSSYRNIEVIVVDDGSKDDTPEILRSYISGLATSEMQTYVSRRHGFSRRGMRTNTKLTALDTYQFVRNFSRRPINLRVVKISQRNAGKAAAMNNAIANFVRGELVMCLDADAVLHPQAIQRAVPYFEDDKVIGVAANVRLMDTGSLLSKVQRFEHIIGYRSKKFYSLTNSEFIIGGVASTYRTALIKQVGLYDCDTATEDIGLSMKLIAMYGNRDKRIVYAADVVAATETVHSFKALLRQRYRWKVGCLQNLFKYRRLIAGGEKGKHNWQLTRYRLPMALVGELRLILEPLLLAYIVYLSFQYQTVGILLGAYLIITIYVLWNIWPDEHLSLTEKLQMSMTGVIMYGLFYIMDVVQVAAIYYCLRNYKDITNRQTDATWDSPIRSGSSMVFSR